MDNRADFVLSSEYSPKGDQPQAIEQLADNLNHAVREQVLLGVTGSGKTFTMANVIAKCGRPAIILAPNKTLAAQLYSEFKTLFPQNAVEYFVSYYDYYQPEAYVPASDTYIEKDSAINDNIDKLRHSATHALLTRRDVIIVASVSCIYGLGSPKYYAKMVIPVEVGQHISMDELLIRLIEVQYERNDVDFHRGSFRVRGDIVEIIPAYQHEQALRIEFFGDEIDSLSAIDPLTGNSYGTLKNTVIYPASHYVSAKDNLLRAIHDIRSELSERLVWFKDNQRLVEEQRLEQRTQLDLEMLEELGYCNGVENYTRHLDGRCEGEPPACLLDYFPDDYIMFIDESHVTVPQLGAMYKGDRSRKSTLVEYGFRLPSALDNRPLRFEEFRKLQNQTVYVSATPGKWELEHSEGIVIEQIIRPTGLLDPEVEVRPTEGQMDDLLNECRKCIREGNRVLVTTLTKRMAEDLTDYSCEMGVNARYLHSDIDTMERINIISALRAGEYDVLIGINLLREGLDIPEVSLVAILDADKEGFLRSAGSLIQTFGRAARNVRGRVILYADSMTGAMKLAINETVRRRELQMTYNSEHGIEPRGIRKTLDTHFEQLCESNDSFGKYGKPLGKTVALTAVSKENPALHTAEDVAAEILRLEKNMRAAARDLNFEKAAVLRDRVVLLRQKMISTPE